jgi:hypothetical protein
LYGIETNVFNRLARRSARSPLVHNLLDSLAGTFAALKEGRVDAFSTDKTVLRAIVRQDEHADEYVLLPDFTKSRKVGFALKKDEPRHAFAVPRHARRTTVCVETPL